MAFSRMKWLDQQDALDLLRISEDNAGVAKQLADSVPAFIETVTGYPASLTEGESPNELVKQLARFVLQLWYNPDGTDAAALRRVVDSLGMCVKSLVVDGGIGEADGPGR